MEISNVLQGSGEAAGGESQLREVGGGHGSLCDKHFISLLTGNLPQSVPHRRPPAQPCWPVCRGPRTHQANTWPARARAWSCGSVSGSPHPAQYPLRLSPSSAHPESTGLCFCSWTALSYLRPLQGITRAGKECPLHASPVWSSPCSSRPLLMQCWLLRRPPPQWHPLPLSGQLPPGVTAFPAAFSNYCQHHGPNANPPAPRDPSRCHVCLAYHHFPALAESGIRRKQIALNGIPVQGLIRCVSFPSRGLAFSMCQIRELDVVPPRVCPP